MTEYAHYKQIKQNEIKRLLTSLYLYGLLIFILGVISIFIFQEYSVPLGLKLQFFKQRAIDFNKRVIYLFEYSTSCCLSY